MFTSITWLLFSSVLVQARLDPGFWAKTKNHDRVKYIDENVEPDSYYKKYAPELYVSHSTFPYVAILIQAATHTQQ